MEEDKQLLEEQQEREEVRKQTEENRKAIPETVIKFLAERDITLDDILKMDRHEFEDCPIHLIKDRLAQRALIRFKHGSMTIEESVKYDQLTPQEEEKLAEEDEEFKRSL